MEKKGPMRSAELPGVNIDAMRQRILQADKRSSAGEIAIDENDPDLDIEGEPVADDDLEQIA